MELLTLDSNYQPAELIERFGSLVWTERYSSCGDFQLVTTDIARISKLLPLESTVTIRESTVPMQVEAHKIEKSKAGPYTLTVVGRSFESVLERRVVVRFVVFEGPTAPLLIPRITSPSEAAYQAILFTIGNNADIPPTNSSYDALPMVDVIRPADYVDNPPDEDMQTYEVKAGNLYTSVMELLNANHHALKAVRPVLGSNKIGIEIYNGADLTDLVVFDAKFDQFDDATYLLSYTGSANWAYVASATGSQTVAKNAPPIDDPGYQPSGLDRRVLYLDVSSEADADSLEARYTRGLIELYKNNVTALFDGHISEQVASGYNRDYFLGDIVRLDGEFGLSENVRVAEFIRSDDSTGSKAYPTFEMVT